MGAATCIAGSATQARSYDLALGEGVQADLLLTDPPYCLLTRRRKGGDLRDPRGRKIDREEVVRFESVRDYRRFTEGWLPLAVGRLRGDRPLVLWTNLLGKAPLLQVSRELGYPHLWGEYRWAKRTTDKNANEQLLRLYEVALVIGKAPLPPQAPDEPPRVWAAVSGYDDEGEGQTWDHPHHKPYSSLEPLVRAWSRPGDLVLDPFAGSGSIPVAAQRLGRRIACLELRPDWAQNVTRRLAAETAGR